MAYIEDGHVAKKLCLASSSDICIRENAAESWQITTRRSYEPFPILALNDDLLTRICEFLPLEEQTTFSTACPRFHDIFGRVFKKRFNILSSDDIGFDDDNLEDWRGLLNDYGHLVETFKLCIDEDTSEFGVSEMVKIVFGYCPNIHSVSLKKLAYYPGLYETYLEMDTLIEFLKLPKLGTLDLEIAEDLVDSDFKQIIENLKDKLRVLNLTYSSQVEETLPDLHKHGICQLSSLEELSIVHAIHQSVDDKFLKQIANSLPNLKRFKLYWENADYTSEEGTIAFIREAPKLEYLEILTCLKFDVSNFIKGVIKALREKGAKRTKLRLNINDCTSTYEFNFGNKDFIGISTRTNR